MYAHNVVNGDFEIGIVAFSNANLVLWAWFDSYDAFCVKLCQPSTSLSMVLLSPRFKPETKHMVILHVCMDARTCTSCLVL